MSGAMLREGKKNVRCNATRKGGTIDSVTTD